MITIFETYKKKKYTIPEVGDYVLVAEETKNLPEDLQKFLRSSIGMITADIGMITADRLDKKYNYIVKFENVPKIHNKYFFSYTSKKDNERDYSLAGIECWAKTKAELAKVMIQRRFDL